ncbi:MAG: DJ-1/PfpI family protein [Thermoplasmata archaeon]|nr:DJ-1/PfpI family protein [Thermoplasmata archaeon]
MSKAAVIFAPGFEEIEALTVVDVLRRCNIDVDIVGTKNEAIEGSHNVKISPDKNIDDVNINEYDALILPGGAPGYINLREDERVINLLKNAFENNKIIAAICASPTVLAHAGILNGKKATVYPGMEDEIREGGAIVDNSLVVQDGNIITSRGPATAMLFALKLAEILAGEDVAEEVRKKLLLDMLLEKTL